MPSDRARNQPWLVDGAGCELGANGGALRGSSGTGGPLGGALGAEGALLGRGRFGSASELELDSFRGARESPEVGSGSVDASPEASDAIAPVYGLNSFGGGRPLLSLAGYTFQQAFSGLRLTAGIGFCFRLKTCRTVSPRGRAATARLS